jgi:replication factor A1
MFDMKVSDLKDKSPVEEIKLTITALGEVRDTSYGKVQSTTANDDTGTVQLSLWNDQIGKFNANDNVIIKKGWCKEFRGQMQISTGKFGTIETV